MKVPEHIAVIMDGNGRWAKERGLPRMYGHREGSKRVKEILREAKKLNVKILTIFAFSTENWDRPKKEINYLFSYLETFLEKYKKELMKDGIKVNIIGRRDRITKRIVKKIEDIEKLTKDNKDFTFNISLDYGGRWDITEAAKKIIKDCKDNKISEDQIDEDFFSKYLSLGGVPNPDLLIRTSGEQRISNFLLWDLAYAEFYFPEIYWPDFNEEQLRRAINVYDKRERRFGTAND
jgi:undecaprenyl diphosphate synthase